MFTATTVDACIAAQPLKAQPRLRELRAIIRSAAREATEFISYGMPTYRQSGRRVFFNAANRHCALYGAPIDLFADELRAYRTSKGTIQFPFEQPVPADLVHQLAPLDFDRAVRDKRGDGAHRGQRRCQCCAGGRVGDEPRVAGDGATRDDSARLANLQIASDITHELALCRAGENERRFPVEAHSPGS